MLSPVAASDLSLECVLDGILAVGLACFLFIPLHGHAHLEPALGLTGGVVVVRPLPRGGGRDVSLIGQIRWEALQ